MFWDRDIPPGKTFHQHIEQQIASASCVVAVWSNSSLVSDWVLEEAEEAKSWKILVPVRVDQIKPPFGFRDIHAADLTGWKRCISRAIQRLCAIDCRAGSETRSAK